MKRRIQIITAVLLLLTMLVPASVFGADSSVSITGGKSAKVGDTVTVTVTYRGDALGYVNGQLTYDNSKREYLSGGSSQGDAGLVELKAVSYTHLDVYKRQDLFGEGWNCQNAECRLWEFREPLTTIWAIRTIRSDLTQRSIRYFPL